ncbi:MAG: hypothetical protein TEF_14190 [Rhizobiales bacterium NRL2]|jgi:hypothetical protein|nr:MAG: hypothetical protein TEF_14190 [Rhizobiales bacterium NRL2]
MMNLQPNDTMGQAGSTGSADTFEAGLRKAARQPETAQADVLRRILARNAETVMGRRHGFAAIGDVEAYRRAVPVHEFHALRPMIEMQRASGQPVLSADRPVTHLPASGAVRRCDRVPLVAGDLAYRARAREVAHRALARESGFAAGRVLDLGALAGTAGADPVPGLRQILDLEARAYVVALLWLGHRDVTGIDAGRLESLDLLQDVLGRHGERLLADLEGGELSIADRLPSGLAAAARDAIAPDDGRIEELSLVTAQEGVLSVASVWPSLTVVAADLTADDSGRPAWLPIRVRIVDTGCELSEVRATVAMGLGETFLPLLTEAYFEFAEVDAEHPAPAAFLGLYGIRPGQDYQVFVTTMSGLYRYRLKATVRVDGHLGRCPTLRVRRHDLQTGLAEQARLQVSQANAAAGEALDAAFGDPPRFTLLGGPRKGTFRLLLERRADVEPRLAAIAEAVDRRLRRASLAYDTARADGAEAAVTVGFREHRPASARQSAQMDCSAA